ncbi:hypothetical protein [Actinacidiphila sp. bgisy160]|uniref:hypothetical protein n=1 Tax=Actinacidiphila sp. bgisy160 TaxID=3413796 RepID=UPI003D73A208
MSFDRVTYYVPRCPWCGTRATGPDGQEPRLESEVLGEELRAHMEARGWQIAGGEWNGRARVRTPLNLRCARCAAATAVRTAKFERDLARPAVRTVDMSARLGDGWSLVQRDGDEERRLWLVRHGERTRGQVARYVNRRGGLSGWQAWAYDGGELMLHLDAVSAALWREKSSFLWRTRDLAAWGVAVRPKHSQTPPAWARSGASARA